MAETAPSKPSTPRKRTPAKKPTKAAALKALGLTQEDLDTLKLVAQARNAATSDVEREQLEEVVGHTIHSEPDEEVKESPHDEYLSSIPNALKTPEERRQETGADVPLFVRNRQNCDVSFRLSRQKTGPRTELKPRGQRGDLTRLSPEDYGDPVLDRQLAHNLIEIITLAEARDIIDKQATNAQHQVHPALAMLRNPLGEEYAPDSVRIEPEFNSQGITVATLDPRQMRGELTDTEVKRGAGLQRVQQGGGIQPANPQQFVQAPTQGNPAIVGDGYARNDAATLDAIARRRDVHGPAAGGVTAVTVAPVQRT